MGETDLRALGDSCWTDFDFRTWNRAIQGSQVIPVTENIAYIATRGIVGNVTLIATDDGLVVVDTGSRNTAEQVHDAIRRWSDDRINTVIYTHGHIDHVCGVSLFDEEAERHNVKKPMVVAHQNVERRFERYQETSGWNARINGRQFKVTGFQWPEEYRRPDTAYDRNCTLAVGGRTIELSHGIGETDDHTWIWVPDARTVISGDFVIWAAPNAGNPQKVQRYALGWARALRAMSEKRAEVLIPGHGPAVFGADRVARMLDDGAEFLESIHHQTIDCMNAGMKLSDVLHEVEPPAGLLERPYLKPTYDDPEFVVRNVWRLYGGWFDGNPANLKPARDSDLATVMAELAGGPAQLAKKALEFVGYGELRLAGHLAEFAALADPESQQAHQARLAVNEARAKAESCLMAKGIFTDAAEESREALGGGRSKSSNPRIG